MKNFTLKLNKEQYGKIVKATFPDYKGRTVKIVFTDKVGIYNTNWDGGSRTEYCGVRSDGKTALLQASAPWSNPEEGAIIALPEDVMIVTHAISCGQDCGITIYAHPSHLPKWIEAPAA